jgi:hypothetical protein
MQREYKKKCLQAEESARYKRHLRVYKASLLPEGDPFFEVSPPLPSPTLPTPPVRGLTVAGGGRLLRGEPPPLSACRTVGLDIPCLGLDVPYLGMNVPCFCLNVPFLGMNVPCLGLNVPGSGPADLDFQCPKCALNVH